MNKGISYSLALLGLVITLILLLSYLIVSGSTYEADTYLLRLYRGTGPDYAPLGSPKLQSVIRDFTSLGSGVVLTCLTIYVGIYHFLRRQPRTALFIMITILLGWLAMEGIKLVYNRGRPTVVPHMVIEASLSLPSGHSMMSTIVFLTLAALASARTNSRPLKVFYFTLAVLLALCIGASRVYLGVHHPSDVLAGWLLGLAWVLLAFIVRRAWWRVE